MSGYEERQTEKTNRRTSKYERELQKGVRGWSNTELGLFLITFSKQKIID